MAKTTAREMTADEVRDAFLSHIWSILDECANESRMPTAREKLELFAHSILAFLDGCSGEMPGFHLVANIDDEDVKHDKKSGKNWYPRVPHHTDEMVDIAGSLHDRFYELRGGGIDRG